MQKQKKIAPSLLAADFANLERDIKMVEQAGAHLLHYDVMDGHFVPNISIGIPVLKAVKRVATTPVDVHLMIENPGQYVDAFTNAGADYLTVHMEAAPHLHRVIQHIKSNGIKAGVALNPHTPLNTIEEILPELDLILLMSVNPGFGGQSFIANTLDKLKRLNYMLAERGLEHIEVEVDGGVKYGNISEVAAAGADILVSGSGIFKADDPVQMVKDMQIKLENITAYVY
ncbi:MAG TPA: ribulose-phosphate 3-epimerase [Bacteroidetes bacterium]|nr:ribulose-phosphate 3-epimerase [Bacteroidota bacterium]